MNVFLVNPVTRFDLSTLEAYGQLQYFTMGYLSPFDPEACMSILRAAMSKFDPSEDYICMTGNMQLVAYMMMVAYERFGTFKVLIFDATRSNYKERIVSNE